MSLRKITQLISGSIKNQLLVGGCQYSTLRKLDTLQETALDRENCILVDNTDRTIGSASKRACHVVGDGGDIPLHRAFSVFLFNSKGDMLMQRRGRKKVTFPNVYTNACCSHPLWIGDAEEDILTAARRRMNHELGIPLDQLSESDFNYLTRIHYYHQGDGKWGEHEIDYILFVQKDVLLEPNREEIDEICYIPKDRLDESISKFEAPISPWFKLVLKHRLRFWWNNLNELHLCQDHNNIHKFA